MPASSLLTRWEHLGEATRWGQYLAEVERSLVLRGENWAGHPRSGIDLGCGGGRWSKLLNDRGWSMTCIDVDAEALSLCERKLPHAKCIQSRSTDRTIAAASGSAGIALCIEAAPLIESDWFAGEAYRVLARGGVLVGVFINGKSPRGILSRAKDWLLDRQTEYSFYRHSYADCRKRLMEAGFEVRYEESFCWGPFARDSNSPFVPAFTRLERAFSLRQVIRWGPWISFIAQKS